VGLQALSGAGSGRRRAGAGPIRHHSGHVRGLGRQMQSANMAFRNESSRALRSLSSEGHEELVGIDVLQLQVELFGLFGCRRGT